MKLFEIRDISDFRGGDQHDPRSPYYKEPFPNGIPDHFRPELPNFEVKVASGKAPNGEDYNFILVSSYDKQDKDQHMIWEHALNELAGNKKFNQSELVDQVDQIKGNTVTWTDFYAAGRGFPVNEIVGTLNSYAKEIAERIAEKNAQEYTGDDDY